MEQGAGKELGSIIKYLYENYEMLSRWTPEFTAKEFLITLTMREDLTYSIGELSRLSGFPMSTTSFIVSNLVTKKIISRKPNAANRRTVMVRLTPKGRKAIAQYDAIFEAMARRMLGRLSEAESAELMRLIAKIVAESKTGKT